ncbi:MAG: hypothetical protein JW795_18315 [Chitinivibrionales bacterium]|nr:hypothetical protein [Chitinivibrionales bacterium]
MKQRVLIGLFCLGACILQCTTLAPLFEEIEETLVTTADFVYQNCRDTTVAEAMPGDDMNLFAYCAGEKISSVTWHVSYAGAPAVGSDTIMGLQPLVWETVNTTDHVFSKATQCIGIKFKVPQTVLHESRYISDKTIKSYGLSRTELLHALDTMAKTPPQLWDLIVDCKTPIAIIRSNMPLFLQLASCPVTIVATINGTYQVISQFTVRYNRYFSTIASLRIHANRNPAISFMGIYKIHNSSTPPSDINQLAQRDTVYCLYERTRGAIASMTKNSLRGDTIAIDRDYTYYLVADTGVFFGVDQRDTVYSIQTGKRTVERMATQWFFQLDNKEKNATPEDKRMRITTTGSFLTPMIPPGRETLSHAVLWLQLYDKTDQELYRSPASALCERTIYFRYNNAAGHGKGPR